MTVMLDFALWIFQVLWRKILIFLNITLPRVRNEAIYFFLNDNMRHLLEIQSTEQSFYKYYMTLS